MSKFFEVDVDTRELVAAFAQLGEEAERLLQVCAKETAENIAREARGRVARATGTTAAGIVVERSYDGHGYVVITRRQQFPDLPRWIEKGTRKGEPGSHSQAPRPFLDISARLEESGHMRRVEEAMQDAIDRSGLGS